MSRPPYGGKCQISSVHLRVSSNLHRAKTSLHFFVKAAEFERMKTCREKIDNLIEKS